MGVEVCPVYIAQSKCFQISSIHVGAMLCDDPQPRGLKRKYSEGDDDDPDNTDSEHHHYSRRRQEILHMSYAKLCRLRQGTDTGLLRYVLIYNTMRCIEQEMEREGIKINCYPGGSFLSPVNCQVSTLDPPPSPHAFGDGSLPIGPLSPYSFDTVDSTKTALPTVINSPVGMCDGVFSNSASYSGDYDRCLVDLDSSSTGRITPFVRTAYDRVESGALWTDEGDRLSSLNWSSVLNFSSGSSSNASSSQSSHVALEALPTTNGHFDVSSNSSSGSSSDSSLSCELASGTETSLHTLMPPSTIMSSCMSSLSITYSASPSNSPNTSSSSGNTSPATGSSPSSSEDEIFGDVDLNLYDFDYVSPLSPPNVKMAPVTSAEELMRSLSSDQESTSSCPGGSSYYRSEYFNDDREHVTTSVRS